MTFKTLEQRNFEKKRGKNKLQKIVAITIPTTILLYSLMGIPKILEVNKKLEPLKEQFKYTAKNNKSYVERIQGFDERKVLDYGGALDSIRDKRDKICKENDCFYNGRWISSDSGVYLDGGPFCYWPF